MMQSPSQGIEILENLYKKHPNDQGILNSLINAYIKFNHHDAALKMIADISDNKTDIQSLKFRAWECHKNNYLSKEKAIWEKILSKVYKSEVNAPIHSLIQKSSQHIALEQTDIVLVSIVRNELIRLPFFLRHYRSLGISQFFFIDNNSDDGSLEFLLNQPDCHVFWTNDSYNEAGSGVRFVHHILDTYIREGQWCIHADADEFLVYPHYETVKLPKLIKYLDICCAESLSAFMLDLYPKNLKTQLTIDSEDNLIKKNPYFYNNYKFLHQIEPPYIHPVGGIFSYFGIKVFSLTKTSLFKYNKNFRLLSSTHQTTPAVIPDISGCYLHMKFIGDFENHCHIAMKEKEHCSGGQQYQRYATAFNNIINKENFDFSALPKTTKYQNSEQLVELGLINTSDEWEKFVHMEDNNNE